MRCLLKTMRHVIPGIVIMLAIYGCLGAGHMAQQQNRVESEEVKMSSIIELEKMLANGNWSAVDLAKELGHAAWPVIHRASEMPNYLSRQIAMICAGNVGGDQAGPVLVAGLSDRVINVRLAAAGQLSVNPPDSAREAILSKLSSDTTEEDIRELLALAAGHLHGERTMQVLRPLAEGNDSLAEHARMALAKLGDPGAREWVMNRLSASEPLVRYEGLQDLEYLNDAGLVPRAKLLLADQANALVVGHERRRRYRRVCDQAVDTLVYLLKLKPSFETGAGKIYSHGELTEIGKLAQ